MDIHTLNIDQNVRVNVSKQSYFSKVLGHIKSLISPAKKKQDLNNSLNFKYEEMGIQRVGISDLEKSDYLMFNGKNVIYN